MQKEAIERGAWCWLNKPSDVFGLFEPKDFAGSLSQSAEGCGTNDRTDVKTMFASADSKNVPQETLSELGGVARTMVAALLTPDTCAPVGAIFTPPLLLLE